MRSERKYKYAFQVSKFISKLLLNVLTYVFKFFIPKDLSFSWKFFSKFIVVEMVSQVTRIRLSKSRKN
ncbi:hypothetical protein LEP1GSC192_1779 [Leptospira sp. B5-022]|nr:hypothetical protein LEP1GSC192_1779 [Leptospira sp. B5-022]